MAEVYFLLCMSIVLNPRENLIIYRRLCCKSLSYVFQFLRWFSSVSEVQSLHSFWFLRADVYIRGARNPFRRVFPVGGPVTILYLQSFNFSFSRWTLVLYSFSVCTNVVSVYVLRSLFLLGFTPYLEPPVRRERKHKSNMEWDTVSTSWRTAIHRHMKSA